MSDTKIVDLKRHADLPTFPVLKRMYTGSLDAALNKYVLRYGAVPDTVYHIKQGENNHEYWIGVE